MAKAKKTEINLSDTQLKLLTEVHLRVQQETANVAMARKSLQEAVTGENRMLELILDINSIEKEALGEYNSWDVTEDGVLVITHSNKPISDLQPAQNGVSKN